MRKISPKTRLSYEIQIIAIFHFRIEAASKMRRITRKMRWCMKIIKISKTPKTTLVGVHMYVYYECLCNQEKTSENHFWY